MPGTWKVNCKACRKPVVTGHADPVEVTDDGSPVYSASCGLCGTTTKYRRPAPIVMAPAYAPPEALHTAMADMVNDAPTAGRELRLPQVVLDAAWWVKFTLIVFWILAGIAFALYLARGILMMWANSSR